MEGNFRILSTKLLSSSQRFRLLEMGVDYCEHNFIQTQPFPFSKEIDPDAWSIFTSQYAVECVFNSMQLPTKKCFCVGEKTKQKLLSFGQEVIKMTSNAADLATYIQAHFTQKKFVFFAGKQRMPTLESVLQNSTNTIKVVEVYDTLSRSKKTGSMDGILFFSPSGVASYHLENTIGNAISFAIGETTAKSLEAYTQQIITAKEPTIEHTLLAVKKYLNDHDKK